jgi:hypothetical protein
LKQIPAAKAAKYLSAVVRRVMPTRAAQTATGARLAATRTRNQRDLRREAVVDNGFDRAQ